MIKKSNQFNITCKKLALAISVSSSALLATLVYAQDSADNSSAATTIEEVLVTAQRRSQNLQDVPITVTTFGATEIQNSRVQDIGDIAVRTPGLSFDVFPAAQPRLAIRGIGSSDRGAAGDPSSAMFVDEIYLGRPAAIAFDAFDVERIEVLKGPQGTLYGRNVVGGAINVITKSPDPEGFDASLEATSGNYNRTEGAGFINIPLAGGMAAIRVGGAIRTHDGYTENRNTGGELDDQNTKSMRIQGLLKPTETLELRLGFDATKDRAAGPGQHVLDLDTGSPYAPFWTVNRDRDYSESELDGYQNRDTWGVRGQLIWDLSFASINYLTSYRELDYNSYYDFDGGNPSFNGINIAGGDNEESELYSQELRVSSLDTSAINWTVGVFQYKADTKRDDILDLALGAPAEREQYNQDAELESLAVYGDATVPVTENLNITAGLRYTEDKKSYAVNTAGSTAYFRALGSFAVDVDETWKAVTWRIGGDYHLNDSNMIYVMASRGFKSGGFQDTPADAVGAVNPYEPEFAIQYELGQKSDFFGRHLLWNNTFYLMDYTDLQTRQANGLAIITTNAGEATIKGYETDLTWKTENGFSLGFTYAYTDATFSTYVENGVDLAGKTISRTPKNKFVISPSYVHSLSSGAEIVFSADYQYASRIYDDNSNAEPELRDPTKFLDARAVYTSAAGNWIVSVWGKNLTDEETRIFQSVFLGANFGAYNPPKTYGLTARWNY